MYLNKTSVSAKKPSFSILGSCAIMEEDAKDIFFWEKIIEDDLMAWKVGTRNKPIRRFRTSGGVFYIATT